ncbi:MAG: ATP-binding protein [Solirubrobacteraceae bacterium]|jgi:signal transduction histidine kinase
MSGLPTRLRLTIVFATTMTIVLSVAGLFVYERFRSQLDQTIDLDVSTQASSLLSLIRNSDTGLARVVSSPLVHGHENFVQVLDARGRILAATPGLGSVALLKGKRLRQALARGGLVTRGKSDPLPEGSRLLTTPIHTQHHGSVVLIVGTSLDQRESSLSELVLVLAIVGPLALAVASLAAYRLASAALTPVELMRRRAAAVSASEPGVRLPLPRADDEIRRLGITLNEMLERLERAFAHERSFVANASHELRTPLATLKAELDLALRRQRPADELRAALHAAQDEVDRLSALADDLLILARADEGRLPIRPAELDVGLLLNEVRARLDPGGARVTAVEPRGLHVVADPQRLAQALGNLVDNALRYSPGAITLSAQSGEGGVELHVQDAGPGFPDAFIAQAFERFARADPGRTGPGAGLGLSLVAMIAEAHGGEARAANLAEGGADVWIVIPAGAPAAPQPVLIETAQRGHWAGDTLS